MKLILTEAQLLEEWQLRAFPSNRAVQYTMTGDDAMDTEAVLRAHMNDWYRRLLREAPDDMLNPVDVATDCAVETAGDGTGRIILPEGTLRVAEVRMSGWTGSAAIVMDRNSRTALLQRSRYTRGTAENPVVVAEGEILRLYPAAGELVKLTAIVDKPGIYALDSAAFATIDELWSI